MLFNWFPAEFKIINNSTVPSFKANLGHFFLHLNYKVDHLELFSCLFLFSYLFVLLICFVSFYFILTITT